MSIGAKNRIKQNAQECREHLAEQFPEHADLLPEFIAEIEGPERDAGAWGQFADQKRDRNEMLERAGAAFLEWLG
jgi:hypothetical protein